MGPIDCCKPLAVYRNSCCDFLISKESIGMIAGSIVLALGFALRHYLNIGQIPFFALTGSGTVILSASFLSSCVRNCCSKKARETRSLQSKYYNQLYKGNTLHSATQDKDGGDIRKLRQLGFSVNAQIDKGRTPLHLACLNGKVESVRALLAEEEDVESVNVNAKDDKGDTALHYAAHNDKEEIVSLLVNHPCIFVNSQNNEGNTPLHVALKANIIENIKLLIEKANLNTRNNQEQTVLHLAGSKEAVTLLIERTKHTNPKDKEGKTPPFYFISAINSGAFCTILEWVSPEEEIHGRRKAPNKEYNWSIDINHQDNEGNTLLHTLIEKFFWACKNQLFRTVEMPKLIIMLKALMELQPDLTLKNKKGQTAPELLETYRSSSDFQTISQIINRNHATS